MEKKLKKVNNKKKKDQRSQRLKKAVLLLTVGVFLIISVVYLGIKFLDEAGLFREDVSINFSPNTNAYGFSFNNIYYYSTLDGLKSTNHKGKEIKIDETLDISALVRGMLEPIFLKSDKTAIVFDSGGKTAVLFNTDGIIKAFSFDREIINAKVAASGKFLFILSDSGAKAVVRAYDPTGFELFYWYSGAGYVVDAMLNNSKNTMAVITNEAKDGSITSKISFFDLNQSEPFLQKAISNTVCSYLSYTKDGCMVVCDDGVYFVTDAGMLERVMDFSNKIVREFKSFTNGELLICCENQDNQSYTIEVLNTKGRRIKKFPIKAFDRITDISSDRFLVVKRKEIISYSKGGRVMKTIPSEFEIRSASYFNNRVSILGNDSLSMK